MTDSIRIDAGIKRILINDGPDFIQFNPSDVVFVEHFYEVIGEFEKKLTEYEDRAKEIDAHVKTTSDGLPANLPDRIAFLRDICEFANDRIDFLFGEGTSQKLFSGMLSLDMIEQFFSGITPFIQQTREEKVAKYKATKSRLMK